MNKQPDIVADLIADGDAVTELVAHLEPARWATPTPAEGWTVAHQIAHLAATFRLAALAASDPERFEAVMSQMSSDFNTNVDRALAEFVNDPPAVLLQRWQGVRVTAEKALGALPGDHLVPWLVRPLPASVLAAAGMMELFGHGQDIADGLGVTRAYTDRIGHLVGFAVRTWDFGYLTRGLTVPHVAFGFELTAPSGQVWRFGPEDAAERITGSAVDFCLLVVRRRHRADLDLVATGPEADRWLDIAQAYRGPAGPGRRPGQFKTVSAR